MSDGASLVVWVFLGTIVGLFSLALPFHKGGWAVALRIAVAIVGALAFGFLGRAVHFYGALNHPTGFMMALIGAFVFAVGFWAIWSREFTRRHGATHRV